MFQCHCSNIDLTADLDLKYFSPWCAVNVEITSVSKLELNCRHPQLAIQIITHFNGQHSSPLQHLEPNFKRFYSSLLSP